MILIIVFLGLLASIMIFRQSLAETIMMRGMERFNENHRAGLTVGSFAFDGLFGCGLERIVLKPAQGDPLLEIGTFHAKLDMRQLFRFKLALRNITMEDVRLHFVRCDSATNYMFLFEHGKKTADRPIRLSRPVHYANRVNRLLDVLFERMPSSLQIRNLRLDAELNSSPFGLTLEKLDFSDRGFETQMMVSSHGRIKSWVLRGGFDGKKRSARFTLFARNRQPVEIPYIDRRWKMHLASDTLLFSLSSDRMKKDVLTLSGSASASNLVINQPRLSRGDALIGRVLADYRVRITPRTIELDSASRVVFNKMAIHPYIRFKAEQGRQITFILNQPHFNANDFIESLPRGLFDNLEGIKAAGDMGFHVRLSVDLDRPDDLVLSCRLAKQNFRIMHYGSTDFSKINAPFLFTAYERGVAVRTFEVGPSNPNYRKLGDVPAFLRNAILTSEDGWFYNHEGFLLDAFREALIANIKQRRFARGGSTISMQLIKNVFLNRDKTITRKLEEALIVWLIENNNLSTKDRMYEVYLNVIEMGPMVYGVNEGAQFYFGKDVSQLSLAEAIYIASIVPHPKWFRYSFDRNGVLRGGLAYYYKLLSKKMLYKGLITQEDYDALLPQVELKGPARWALLPPESIPPVSVNADYSTVMQAAGAPVTNI